MLKPFFFLSFLFFLFIACQKSTDKNHSEEALKSQKELVLPKIHLQKDRFTALASDRLKHSVGGKEVNERTRIQLKYDDTFLEIHFECLDNPRVDQNYITQDDKGLFKQEVFELYIAAGEESPEQYLEIQINPNRALFLGRVTNKFKSDRYYHFDSIKALASGIERKVVKSTEEKSWKGYIKIPWALIDSRQPKETVYRLNMFRIISNKDQFDKNWAGNQNTATYACWSSTMSKKKPNFHHPQYFGFLYLE